MNKQEFLKNLKDELEKNNVHDVQDILADYEEHFVHGLNKGKTELEISEGLGFPAAIAKAYQTDRLISEVKNPQKNFQWSLAFSVIGRLLVIAPFNFIILFIPGVAILTIVALGWLASVIFGLSGVIALINLPAFGTLSTSAWAVVTGFSVGMAFFGMAVLTGMIMFVITKYIVLGLISYLQWNRKLVLQK